MSTNQTTGLPFDPLTHEYARCNPAVTLKHTDPTTRIVRNRQGDTVILTSALLVEHFEWAMTVPMSSTDPQGAGDTG